MFHLIYLIFNYFVMIDIYIDIDECKKVNCGPLSSCINENKTGYRCECLPGYEKNGKHCVG